jgi:preprotein translocase subunit SecF
MKKNIDKLKNNFSKFYKKNYKFLLILPILMFLFSLVSIIQTYNEEGFAFHRDVSLKGGISAIFENDVKYNLVEFKEIFKNEFNSNSVIVSFLSKNGEDKGYIIETDLKEEKLISFLENKFETKIDREKNYSSNFISESLGESFVKQSLVIFLVSLVLMAVVVFLYFKTFIPSVSVVLSVIFDIIVLVGVLDFINFEISIAGIGAILMVIGYSIDTDILLTNRLIKEKNKKATNFEKVYESFITGNLMSFTTICALLIGLIFTNSGIIYQICFILLIGIIIDYISTWIQNASILLWYLEKKVK